MSTPTLALDSSQAAPPSVQPIPGTQPANQTQAQTQLAQIAAAQTAADEQQQQQNPPKDKSKGWSWTNPFQDIGQVWHDVETHTVAPVFHATHWLYTTLVGRPISTLMLYEAQQFSDVDAGKQANLSPFQSSQWKKAWDQSKTISPGQATILAFTDSPFEAKYAQGEDPATLSQGSNIRYVDPSDPRQIAKFQSWAKNTWGGKISTGSLDAAIGWYGDPTSHLTKGTKILRGMKDVPLSRNDTLQTASKKLNFQRSRDFNNWVPGKTAGQIAEHPLVKGTFGRSNPYANQFAALLVNKTPEQVDLLRKIAYDIDPSLTSGLKALADEQASSGSVAGKAFDDLAQKHQDAAIQAANMFSPLDVSIKWAGTAMSDEERTAWLQTVSKVKAQAAQAMLDLEPDQVPSLLKLTGSGLQNTATNMIASRLAEIRGNLKYANTRDSDGVGFIHRAFYNLPVRVYQGLVDRPPGLINHFEDDGVISARSWLNKSAALTPEEKTDYIQRYANATPAQRQHTWRSIEDDVYSKVGDAYGIPAETMQRILTTTRTKQQNFIQLARSKAFGGVKVGDEEHAVLPSTDEQVVLHPQYLAQLENGAMPQANLRDLENALEAMNRNGTLAPIINGAHRSWDTLNGLLDTVYGIWKPLSLMTGHRVYNHVGDDFLRSMARLGALTTIDHLAEGAGNFLRNTRARVTAAASTRSVESQYQQALAEAKAQWEGAKAIAATEKKLKIPEDLRTVAKGEIGDKWKQYNSLRGQEPTFIPAHHRLGTKSFKIAGSNLNFEEMFGGPNADYFRRVTSSHPTFDYTVDAGAHALHGVATGVRSNDWAPISATDPGQLARHTGAYVHYVKNQMMSDPVGKMVVQGRDLDQVSNWLSNTAAGRAHMKALHIGDPDRHVADIASDVRKMLPTDEMREAAATGKFNADVIEKALPAASQRPDVVANLGKSMYGGDPLIQWLRSGMDSIMKWTGTLPDDIMVRHPFVNAMYKNRLTDQVQRFIATRGRDITLDELQVLQEGAMRGARKDMQNTLYDVSRFNDLGHTLRFVSPFFNAWFNAMTSWSHLFMENPTLLSRTYQAKRALWNSSNVSFGHWAVVNTDTGQMADTNTPWEKTAFVVHMPKALSGALGGLTDIPIDAKTLVSPTYIDAVGNPGFGPIVAIPLNSLVKEHPGLMNDAVVRSALNEMVDKNSISQLLPSGARDMGTLLQIAFGGAKDNRQYANTLWSLYQEQMYDYQTGMRTSAPQWSDLENQAKYLTAMDLVANRLLPLGFKPAANHSNLVEEYRAMLDKDPKNARQDFYDKYGPAGMVFTQSLSTNPTGIPATINADKLVNKYADMITNFPELGAVIVGPNGSGNYDQMAYDWQVAKGIRQALTPQEAAVQANVNAGWARYGQMHAALLAQAATQGISSLNDPRAKNLKSQLTNLVAAMADPNDKLRYNGDWYSDYTSFSQGAYQQRITELAKLAQDPSLLANNTRSDIRSLHAYVQKRDEIYAQLQQRQHKTLTYSGNFQLAKEFDDYIAQLMHDDTKFGQLYERYLSKDDFKEPI